MFKHNEIAEKIQNILYHQRNYFARIMAFFTVRFSDALGEEDVNFYREHLINQQYYINYRNKLMMKYL